MEDENKRKIKRKKINPLTDEDFYSYRFGSENISPNIHNLPVQKRKDPKKEFRPIDIDLEKASKQTKLILCGIEVFFPYEPYPNQKIYMEKVIEACKKNTIAGLESPTGTGKTLCLLCSSLAYLRHERQRLIEERNNNNLDDDDKTEKIKQPVIYYTSRTHAQLANVIQELKKTCYRPRNAIISSREQMCVNELIKGFHGNTLNMKCQFAQKRNQCRYFKGKINHDMTWGAYDGKTIEELRDIAKKAKFCPFFFERDKSIHSDLIFLPYNYIFDPSIKKRMNIQMKNAILIVDEAHNIQEVCNDAVSKDFDTKTIEEILSDLKSLKIFLEENQIGGLGMRDEMDEGGARKGKNSKNINLEPINIDQLKYEINILSNIRNALNNFHVQSGDKWPNFGLKLDAKSIFELFYKGSKGDNQKQTMIKFDNKNSNNIKSGNKINKKNTVQSSEKTHKSNSNISYDEDEEENISEEELNLDTDKLEPELNQKNISAHIDYLNTYEYFIHNDRGKRTLIGQYVEILELIRLLGDNFIAVEKSDDSNPLHNYLNNFRFFIEDVNEAPNKSANLNGRKKSITSFIKKRNRILHIYCFNPGFGFKNIINENLHATIITSGTLSPIDGMESELKCSFEIKLEGTHVIDKRQVHFGILTSSLPNKKNNKKEEFLFNQSSRNNYQMIEQLGNTIIQLCKVTPGGILVFFSSYGVMEDFIKKWEKSKIISEISQFKVFCQDKHDPKLNKAVLDLYQKENGEGGKGAILFSVCRGSCSEGMNFKNDAARLVIVVGIPFAYLGDPKTQLRKEYQDEFNKYYYAFIKDKNIKKLSGSEWYNQNAIKCVNQALGRVIRHSNDYGCMLLIDSRYQQNNNRYLISKWIRDVCIIYNDRNNESLISNVKNFFNEAKDFTEKKIEEQKKLNEMKKITEKKIISKKRKNKNPKVLDDYEDEIDQEENEYKEKIIKNSLIKTRKNKTYTRLNDDEHFNIINDIKIDELKINSNKENEKKKKKKKLESNKNTNSIKENSSNKNDTFLGSNFDLVEIFGDDIKLTPFDSSIKKQKEQKEQKEEKEENFPNININNINFETNKKNVKSNNNKEENILQDVFDINDIGVSFFDDLKDEKNTTIKKAKPKEENSCNISDKELIEIFDQRKDKPEFKEALRKNKINYKIKDNSSKIDETNSKNSLLNCSLCFSNTDDPNIKMEYVLPCKHFFCSECLDKIYLQKEEKKEEKLKCPSCNKVINSRKRVYII